VHRGTLRVIATTALVMVVTDACAGDHRDSSADWVAVALGGGDPFLVDRAVEAEIAECMSERGWKYTPLPIPMITRPRDELDDRRRRGFGISIDADDRDDLFEAHGDDPNAAYVAALSEHARVQFITALNDPSDGCAVTATDTIASTTRRFMQQLPDELRDLIDAYNLGTDRRLLPASAAWAACMSDAGFRWSTRTEMFDELNRAVAGGRVAGQADQNRERAAATADFTCAADTIEPVLDQLRDEIQDLAEGMEGPAWTAAS
jgi:hypothetical protein